MQKLAIFLIALSFVPLGSAEAGNAAADPDKGKLVVYRDDFGVPHIFAPNMKAGLYAMGYCQAEDRLEELLKNYLRAMGEMAAAFGQAELSNDIEARVWPHYTVARRNYGRISPVIRDLLAAYVRGINDYMVRHRDEVPPWWGNRRADVYMVVAHSRHFMWGWPAGQALGELQRAGVAPNFTADSRSSNEMALAPSRTAMKAPILIIDPHLSWWGAQRFWEFRIHAGRLNGSGFTLPGTPFIGLGHNEHVAWAMTTGGPDTADIYTLRLNPDNPLQYSYDGSWRNLAARKVSITVKGEPAAREITLHDSHNGPVVARRDNNAYVARLSYADEVQFVETFYHFNMARNVDELRRGLDLNQLMPQNVMAADTSGNIYYQRAGRVPIRPDGYDFSRPVDGSTSRTEWLGIHPARDLISIQNPPQGYMQNCNVPPDVMMAGSPLTPGRWKPYLFYDQPGRIHQRGARAVEALQQERAATIDKAISVALDTRCYGYEKWTEMLKKADVQTAASYGSNKDYTDGLRDVLAWNGRSDATSVGALKYYYWRLALRAAPEYRGLAGKLTDYEAVLGMPAPIPAAITGSELKALSTAFLEAMKTMRRNHGRIDVPYGQVFRVGRDDRSWPVGGGSLVEEGMATLRAIGFEPPRPDHTRWGRSGQTSTQVVVLTRPVQSWTQPPIGQSDRPDSPFYRDQAEKLFSKATMKPTWYRKDELLKHVHSRTELEYPR